MQLLKTGPSEIAQWHQLVLDAESHAKCYLNESLENYVVMTLFSYTRETKLTSVALAIEFLNSLQNNTSYNLQKLRDVGDHCLILSGLFPQIVRKKNVNDDYLMNMGKEAYYTLSFAPIQWHLDSQLFYQLFESFKDVTKILRSMRT